MDTLSLWSRCVGSVVENMPLQDVCPHGVLCPARTMDSLYARTLLMHSELYRSAAHVEPCSIHLKSAITFEVPQSIEKRRCANDARHSVNAGPFLLVARCDRHRAVTV